MKSIAIGAHLLRDDVEPHAGAVPVGDLFLSSVSVDDDHPLGDRDLLVRVAGIRAKLLEVATFVALRYGFTFAGAEQAQSKTLAHHARWKRLLTEHRQHVEVTLKVAATSRIARPDRKDFTSGAEYLRALHAATNAATIDAAFKEAAERLIVPLAIRHRWIHRDEKSVELAALIERGKLEQLKAAGEELRESSVPFLLSGPWPLEVFADDDHQ
ncbi:MAG TPA: GvpL/GvpF family gas vesicle protein [Thermoanaerobaculia bacterium]|nr:GvpL/GvpF family gas vesicle protein [Thermoanaerobaculia bacterium]